MTDEETNPQGTIVLRPQDIQAIVAGLAANLNAMATMARQMTPPPPPTTINAQETPLSSAAPSLSSQATSSDKLASHSSFRSYLYTSPLAHVRVKHKSRRVNNKETLWALGTCKTGIS